MNAAFGWGLAVLAVVAGWLAYRWPGVLLAVSVIVFWLLLQFSRSLRSLRDAAGRPVGQVPNAVMLHARLVAGMRLADILKLTRSLGRKLPAETGLEVFAWADAAGDEVQLQMRDGKLSSWQLKRAAS